MKTKPRDVLEASAAVASLPEFANCVLGNGQEVKVQRLSWMQFETLWGELAELLSILAAAEGEEPESLASRLSGAPQFVIKLVGLCTGSADSELARWPFDDVLAVATSALRLNFIDSQGVRSFFGALLDLGAEG